jgi:excisionase family DNA binding protein
VKVREAIMQILTLAQVARLLRLHTSTVYRMVSRGEIPAMKVGRVWRFSKEALDRWLNHGLRPEARGRGHAKSGRKPGDPLLRAIGTLAVGTLSKDIDTGLYGMR